MKKQATLLILVTFFTLFRSYSQDFQIAPPRLEFDGKKLMISYDIISSLRIAVINNSNVIPHFGEIKDVGDQGGDFIFIHK